MSRRGVLTDYFMRTGGMATDVVAAAAAGAVSALAGLVTEFARPLNHDVAWLLYLSDRLLGGARLYRDFIEVNPQLIVWLGVPAVLVLSRMTRFPFVRAACSDYVRTDSLEWFRVYRHVKRLRSFWHPRFSWVAMTTTATGTRSDGLSCMRLLPRGIAIGI